MTNDEKPSLIPKRDNRPPLPATAGDDYEKTLNSAKKPSQPKFLGVTPERLQEITEAACKRIDDCRAEMGVNFGQGLAQAYSWAWDRQMARIMFSGNMEHRRSMGIGPLFMENNWSLNVPQRIIRMLAAQHSGDLVGSDPFCAVMPEQQDDPADEKLSKQVEKLVQDEISGSNCRMALSESIRVALTEGERAVKVTWDEDVTQFVGDLVVMVQPDQEPPEEEGPAAAQVLAGPDDEPPQTPSAKKPVPITAEDGDYIEPKDQFLRFYVDADGKPLGLVKVDPDAPPDQQQADQPEGTASIQMRLKKDPSFVLDPETMLGEDGKPVYALCKNLKQTITHHKGLNVSGLFCEDFIYPIKSPSLEDPMCDIMVHCYDEPLDSVKARFRNAGYDDYDISATGNMSQQQQPIVVQGEMVRQDSRDMLNVHETYYRVRVNEDDEHESWVFIVIDFNRRLPIYAEYLGNMKMKKPPFVLLRGLQSEPGRAYGVGVYKMFADKNLAIDVWFNRAALKSGTTRSVTFQHEDAWRAEYQGQKMILGGTEIYKIPANVGEQYGPDHPPVFRVNLNEMSEKEFELMEKLVQDGDLMFGVVNAAPEISNSIGKGTATATLNVERTGNILQRYTEELMATDIEQILDLITDTVLENLDEETVAWTPGEDQIALLSRDEIRDLPRDVRVLLTRAKGDEALVTNQQAQALVEMYYSKPLWLRAKIRDFVIQQLRSLYVMDADEVIEEPTDAQIEQEAQQSQQTPKEALSINYKDAPPDIRRQMEEAAGFKPSTADEISPNSAQPSGTVIPFSGTSAPKQSAPNAASASQKQP